MVCCHRGDGRAFDVLSQMPSKLFILSTETNPVVPDRGKKLKIPVIQGAGNKQIALEDLAENKIFDIGKTLFVGNDLNDNQAIQKYGVLACPFDSQRAILEITTFCLQTSGGQEIVRELFYENCGINIVDALSNDVANIHA